MSAPKTFLTLLLSFLFLGVARAENLYVRPSGAGASNGADWNNAFNSFSDVVWGSGAGQLGAGDTLYIAGGTYTTRLTMGAHGTAGNLIHIKRARGTNSACSSAAGWSSAFDAQVLCIGTPADRPNCFMWSGGASPSGGSYMTIDGEVAEGISFFADPNQINDSSFQGLLFLDALGVNNVTLRNLEFHDTGAPRDADHALRGFGGKSTGYGSAFNTNWVWQYCKFQNMANCIHVPRFDGFTIEYCEFFDNGGKGGGIPNVIQSDHGNLIYVHIQNQVNNFIFRYNDVNNSEEEGIMISIDKDIAPAGSTNFFIYGNIFRNAFSAYSRQIQTFTDVPGGSGQFSINNLVVCNNSFVDVVKAIRTTYGNDIRTGTWKNNIFYSTSVDVPGVIDHDYNWYGGNPNRDAAYYGPYGEAHGIKIANVYPFVGANDHRIVGTVSATMPRDKGVNLGAPFNVDRYGTVRGVGNGLWDIGAFEYADVTPDTTPPSTPTGLNGTAISESRIDITWIASTDNVGVSRYRVLRNDIEIASAITQTMYSDQTGLTPNTGYSYKIIAEDGAGNVSAASAAVNVTTLTVDLTAPSVPDHITGIATSSSSTYLTWYPSTDNRQLGPYRIFRDGVQAGVASTTNFSDSGLLPETLYVYTVKASDASGNLSAASTSTNVTTQAMPDFPTNRLELWLRADIGVSFGAIPFQAVSLWQDQSGYGRHATQSTPDIQPSYVTNSVNGYPAIIFDGVNDFLNFTLEVNGLTEMTIILVAKNGTSQVVGGSQAERAAIFWNESASWGTVYLSPFQSQAAFRFGTTQASNLPFYTRPQSIAAAWSTTIATKSNTVDRLAINGAEVLSQSGKLSAIAACLNTANIGRGYNNNTFFDGGIAEILVYSRALTVAERVQVEEYLSGKYSGSGGSPPTAPADLLATPFSSTRIDVTWTASEDDENVEHYILYRNGVAIANPVGTSYSDGADAASGLTPDTDYTYSARAVDGSMLMSDLSNTSLAHTPQTPAATVRPLTRPRISGAGIYRP